MNAYTYAFDSITISSSKHGGHVWPSEIDYAETLSREYFRGQILNALHTEADDDEHWNRGIDWEDWNIYGFEWKENGKVDFYINNKLVYQSKELLRPDLPHYLVLRIGVGCWIGEPDENTEFPGIQEVDWIRVYKKK